MSGSTIAYMLKQIGRGREAFGLVTVYEAGKFVGTAQTLLGVAAFCAVRGLAEGAYEKWSGSLSEREYIADAGAAD